MASKIAHLNFFIIELFNSIVLVCRSLRLSIQCYFGKHMVQGDNISRVSTMSQFAPQTYILCGCMFVCTVCTVCLVCLYVIEFLSLSGAAVCLFRVFCL